MIQKNLFFIWFGDNKPNYVDFAINEWRKINPDFNIELIQEKDPYTSNNCDIKECMDMINTKNNIYNRLYNRPWAVKNYSSKIGKNVRFSDCFRLFIINKYGGIYVDCDTYPVKPFDDDFLNCKRIVLTCNNIWFDNFFHACDINCGWDLYLTHFYEIKKIKKIKKDFFENSHILNFDKYQNSYDFRYKRILNTKFENDRKDFVRCIPLNFNNDNTEKYFEHYRIATWWGKEKVI